MSGDSFSESSSESWLSRLGSAIGGVLIGGLMFFVAFPLLFWNEGRSVKTYLSLEEGKGQVLPISADKVDPANANKLVHLTGKATTEQKLSDPVFGISANALKLERIVEMYQWEEKKEKKTQKKLGGGEETITTYSYSKVWSKKLIDSGNFKQPDDRNKLAEHRNPDAMPYDSSEQVADPITLGVFTLSKSLVGMITNFAPFSVPADAAVPKDIKDKGKVHDGEFYIGADPASPEIGDAKVSFQSIAPEVVSVVAQQVNSTFDSFQTKAGVPILLLETGEHDAKSMFQTAEDQNTMLTWILRAVGFFIMFLGLTLVFKPLSVLADVVPFIGSMVGAGTGIIAFLIAAPLSLITIAIAWVFYRPLLGIGLLAVAAVLVFFVVKLLRKNKKPLPTAA